MKIPVRQTDTLHLFSCWLFGAFLWCLNFFNYPNNFQPSQVKSIENNIMSRKRSVGMSITLLPDSFMWLHLLAALMVNPTCGWYLKSIEFFTTEMPLELSKL